MHVQNGWNDEMDQSDSGKEEVTITVSGCAGMAAGTMRGLKPLNVLDLVFVLLQV